MNLDWPNVYRAKAASYWKATLHRQLRGSNHIFHRVSIRRRKAVLRITPIAHRDMDAVLSELHFIDHLSKTISVAKALPARDKKKAVLLKQQGKQVIASVFEMACGIPLTIDRLWNPDIIELWGATMGALHQQSRLYSADGHIHRTLDGDILLQHAKKLVGQEDAVIELMKEKWNAIKQNEHITGNWGMIHGDLTQANIHICKDRLCIFDFDDCQYAPYVYDIAITFYVTFLGVWQSADRTRSEQFFIRHFIKGYQQQNDAAVDINAVKLLMDYYNILVYARTRQVAAHPFNDYSLYLLKHGALAGFDEHTIF